MSAKTKGFLLICLAGLLLKPPIAIGDISQKEAERMNNPKEFLHTLVNEKDYKILNKVVECESGWDTEATSTTKDQGIFQLNLPSHLETSKTLGYNIFNWRDNIRYGVELYKAQGLKPWKASRFCWHRP